jgi:hypothetical protein
MARIFKYQLQVADEQQVLMPLGADILCVQVQHGQPFLWALVSDENVSEPVTIFTHGTGHETSEKIGRYIGTYQLQDGAFVGHVFEER